MKEGKSTADLSLKKDLQLHPIDEIKERIISLSLESKVLQLQPMKPIEWMQNIADLFLEIAGQWDQFDSHFIEDQFTYIKKDNPDISKMLLYQLTEAYLSLNLAQNYAKNCLLLIREVEQKEFLLKTFEHSTVFPFIIDAIATLECVLEESRIAKNKFDHCLYYHYYDTVDRVKKYRGEEAVKRYKKNAKLTFGDYESAFEHVTELFKKIEEARFSQKLRESAWKIKVYCKIKVGSEKYEETEKKIKKRRSELEKETFSIPLSQTAWADILHVSENTIRQWRRSTKKNRPYHFNEVSPRRWRLPINELPAEYLKNYSKHLENIGIQKAKKHKNTK
jgi:DNA-binding transcriptional regulator YiaG